MQKKCMANFDKLHKTKEKLLDRIMVLSFFFTQEEPNRFEKKEQKKAHSYLTVFRQGEG